MTSSEKLKMATLEHSVKAIARQNDLKWRPILRVKVGKNIGRTNWTITQCWKHCKNELDYEIICIYGFYGSSKGGCPNMVDFEGQIKSAKT